MSLRDDLERQIRSLHANAAALPVAAQVSDATGLIIRLDLTQLDSMSCAFSELALFVPQLQNAPFSVLQQWASDLTQRVTYLLEKIGPLEMDPAHGQVLIRSNPPNTRPTGTQYYEMLLTSVGNGSFSLRRYKSIAGQPGRIAEDVQVTYEVLRQLIDDLLESIPVIP